VGVVVGTAGHIDHGKTTLLHALTGIDADRLPEERRRGMTIDVGYAHLELPDGETLDFVDVPGHDRLVGNMLVGAGEVDAAMLVVAADDGPRAQTIEHLELLDALGIDDGLIVVTKVDAVADERVSEVVAALGALTAATRLGGAPILVVSSTTGQGLSALREALASLSARVHRRGLPAGPSRLAVDRVFRVKGRGVVVTGTLRGEPLASGASLSVVPGGGTVRARELQVHGRTIEVAEPGRVAINVAGEDGRTLSRGTILTTREAGVAASDRWLVALRAAVGSTQDQLPGDRTRARVHIGTAHAGAVIARTGRDSVDLGDEELSAILRLDAPIAVSPGDRFVLRRPSPGATLAGGRVLDPDPPRGVSRRRGTPARLIALAAAHPGGSDWHAARLELHGAIGSGLAGDVGESLRAAIVATVAGRGELPIAELRIIAMRVLRRSVSLERARLSELPSAAIEELVAGGRLARDGDRVRPAGTSAAGPTPELLAAMNRLEAALSTVAPPLLSAAAAAAGCPPAGVRELERTNRIVRLEDDLAWSAATYRELTSTAIALAGVAPLTPAAFRDATGTSRKYVMAILEDLDRRAILRRTDKGHLPGPRAPLAVPTGAADRSPS
jgi:selenocysteine-specific elongation factor